jgi:hypothetical protein
MKTKLLIFIILFTAAASGANAQFASRFSLAGGPMAGWQLTNVDDLNAEMRRIGLPEFGKSGYVTFGGGGFIDLPWSEWLRVGGVGTGFSAERTSVVNNLTKSVKYDFGMGGASLEYVGNLSSAFQITAGALFGTGTLKLRLYQNGPDFGNWNSIWGEIGGSSTSQNISRELTQRFYFAQPRVGLGVFLREYLYAKLNVGYLVSTNSGWRVDNDVEVTNFPEGIKPDGLDINLGLNFGLFFK